MKSNHPESTVPTTYHPPTPKPQAPASWKSIFLPPPGAPFEFYLSSAWQGLLLFLPIARIWLNLVQLKPDNKTPQYEIYILSWIILPLAGMGLTRFLDRFRPKGLSALLYQRIFTFINLLLVLAAYWDIQSNVSSPLSLDLSIYILAQALGIGAAHLLRRLSPARQNLTTWLYPVMAVLFLIWIPLMDSQWKTRFQHWSLASYLFILLAVFLVFFDLNPQWKKFQFDISSPAASLLLYAALAPFFAFLFINLDAGYCLFNDDFFIGPLADFINGKTMLVDINAQYGVLLYFFLKLIFPAVLPVGFNSFFFLDAVLRLFCYLVFFWMARRLFKSLLYPLACTLVLILLNCQTPPSLLWYPSQGALRFGFIYVLAALVMSRNLHPKKRSLFLWLEAFTTATAAFWSFEVCFYTVPPYLLLTAIETFFTPESKRGSIRDFLKRLIPLSAAVSLILAFIYAFTRLRAGQFPHWDYYLSLVWSYREGFMMTDTPLWGLWWIPVGILFLSLFFLLALREKRPIHWNALVLVAIYGIFQLFYYFGRSVDTALYPLAMPALLLFFYWLYELRVKAASASPLARFSGLGLLLAFLFYAVQPFLPARLDLPNPSTLLVRAQQFLKTSQDLPRDSAFADQAGRLMEKYSGNKKLLVYFFGERGIEVSFYEGRSKLYPYNDIDQPILFKSALDRILSFNPLLKPGDCVYTSPDMNLDEPLPGTEKHLEKILFGQLNELYVLKRLETSGPITVYEVEGKKEPLSNKGVKI